MDQISSAIDKCFSSLITDTDVKNVNDRKEEFNKFNQMIMEFLTLQRIIILTKKF